MNIALKVGVFFLCMGLFFWHTNAIGEIDDRNKTLVIGRVTDNPKKHYKRLKPIVDYVAARMNDLGITRGSVLMVEDNEHLIHYLKFGKIDWVSETPFSALIFSEEAGAEIMLRSWKKGVPEYSSIFFTRKDSSINSIADLKGRKIAFEDPGSTTAYFVPLAILKKEGLDLVKLFSPRESPPVDKVGYVFAGGELNISTWVHKGFTDAGAFSDLDWEDSDDTPDAFRKDLRIIYQTKPFPRAVELVRKDLSPAIKKRLKEILLNAHKDPEAKKVLKAYNKSKKFDEINGDVLEGLNEAKRLLEYIRTEMK